MESHEPMIDQMSNRQTMKENQPLDAEPDSNNDERQRLLLRRLNGYETYDAEGIETKKKVAKGNRPVLRAEANPYSFQGLHERPRSAGALRKEQSTPDWPGLDSHLRIQHWNCERLFPILSQETLGKPRVLGEHQTIVMAEFPFEE